MPCRAYSEQCPEDLILKITELLDRPLWHIALKQCPTEGVDQIRCLKHLLRHVLLRLPDLPLLPV